ncbi:MAG: DUF2784 domain-containing protein [Candidatus Competibacteraceae bacterium]|nr:DUF2784 domain-containing protein [Candidatus Competibacteraceae bacterium]
MDSKHLSLAADATLILHAAFVLFAVFGGFVALIDVRIAIVHIPVVAWSSIVNIAHWTCPLTPLEQKLRFQAGEVSFEDGWIQHYLDRLVRPLGMPRRMELIAGVSIIMWNLLVYGFINQIGAGA